MDLLWDLRFFSNKMQINLKVKLSELDTFKLNFSSLMKSYKKRVVLKLDIIFLHCASRKWNVSKLKMLESQQIQLLLMESQFKLNGSMLAAEEHCLSAYLEKTLMIKILCSQMHLRQLDSAVLKIRLVPCNSELALITMISKMFPIISMSEELSYKVDRMSSHLIYWYKILKTVLNLMVL